MNLDDTYKEPGLSYFESPDTTVEKNDFGTKLNIKIRKICF